MQNDRNLLVFSGNANRPLAEAVCKELGIRLGKALVSRFSDGEVQVEIEENVRRQEVFVIQPTCAPSAENLVELLVLIDALKRASVSSVTAVVPYFGYARQDRRPRSARVPITAKVAAKMFSSVGADRVLTVDLHADQIQGFFDMPVDNVYASPLLLADIWRAHGTDNLIVVSPDVGGVVRARAIAKRLDDADLAIIDKRRPRANVATVMNIIGDVAGKTCVLVDDIVDTAGTLCAAAAALKAQGAIKVVAYCTHPVLSGAAIDNVTKSQLDELVVTDTIPLSRSREGLQPASASSASPSCWRKRSAASPSANPSVRCTWTEHGRRTGLRPNPLTWSRVSGIAAARRFIASKVSNDNVRTQDHGHWPRSRREGCEPPPASRRQHPGHRLRRQRRPAEHPARAREDLARQPERVVLLVDPRPGPRRQGAEGAAA